MKRALVTGCSGQDGSYLCELLLANGYEVHGIIRRSSSFNTGRIDHIFDRLTLHHGDMTDPGRLSHILAQLQPDEVYNLAAQSHVQVSFHNPVYSCHVAAIGALAMLEAAREYREQTGRDVRLYQASSSEMFGNATTPYQSETTPFAPCSPYGCAKVFAHHAAANYREAYQMHVSCGILFNHESPRRGETFVTRKITRAVGRIKAGLQKELVLGNMTASRDWGFAGDYVRAMWMMLQQDRPTDYVVATGVSTTVEAFCRMAFEAAGLDWRDWVRTDPRYERPSELQSLRGDARRMRVIGWEPTVALPDLVDMMVRHDTAKAKEEALCLAASA